MKTNFRKMMMMGCVFMLAANMAVASTAPRLVAKPMDEEQVVIYAYTIDESLASNDAEMPGFLLELVNEVVVHPDLPLAVTISPVSTLTKFKMIQAVGAGMLGVADDFAEEDLKDLIEVPLYTRGETTYSLFFNKRNPEGEALSETTAENLKTIQEDGTYDELKKKYNLE